MTSHHHDGLSLAHHHHVVPRGGPAVLDIGGDIGALIAYVDADLLGAEIHVRADHHPDHTTHTAVWERTIGNETVIVAVFPELAADRYDLLDADGRPSETITIRGGEITEIDLRTGAR
jgi:hypothetical protein